MCIGEQTMMMTMRNQPSTAALAWIALIAIGATRPTTARSESTNGAEDETSPANVTSELEQVVVTAFRRDTELQKTPVSVAAISGATLSQKGALDFIDFAASVPGFTILDSGPAQRRPVIRGIQGAGEGEVGIYYDEFPITSTPGATNDAGRFTPDVKLFDVQQVQILRGPQGTLFGAGSQGGTLQTTFNKPDLREYSGSVAADLGTIAHGTQNVRFNGTLNAPLVDGVLGLRLVGYRTDYGGFIDNTRLGVANINEGRTYGGRASVRYAPTSRLTLDLLTLYNQTRFDTGHQSITSEGDLSSNVPAYDPLEDIVRLYGLTGRYTFNFATLVANASSYRRDIFFNFTFPNLAIPWTHAVAQGLAPHSPGLPTVGSANVQQPQDAKAETFELRLSAPDADAAFQWTLGGFYQDRAAFARSRLPFVGPDGRPDPIYPLFADRTILSSLDQRAGFGELSYEFFGRLTATAGGRWQEFSASQAAAFRINTGGSVGTNTYTDRDFSDSSFIKRFNLSYQLTDVLMGYTTYSEGFRAGGANQAVNDPTVPAGYASDTVKNYEVGFKSQWFNRRLTVNADYYRMDWENIQTQGSTPSGLFRFTTNAGQAQIDGIEFEAHARPVRGLDLALTWGRTIARLTQDKPVNPGLTASGYAGDRLPQVPQASASFSADYAWPLANGRALSFYTNYQYVGKSQNLFSPFLADPATGARTSTADPGFAYMPAYSVLDVRVGVQSDRWSASIYANNIGNERGITNVLWNSPFTPGRYTYYITPRVIGLSASASL
jgi:iron complex outermembrane recepter protein